MKEDNVVRILAVANPTLDLAAGEREVIALKELAAGASALLAISGRSQIGASLFTKAFYRSLF